MRKVRRTLPIVLTALAILGLLAVSSHASKPSPGKPVPIVTVAGGIVGTGDPAKIRVTFADTSFGLFHPESPSFISNPDGSLRISFKPPDTTAKILTYYYCIHPTHVDTEDLICQNPVEHNDYYYCLQIFGGIADKKGDNDHVTFLHGSRWEITQKKAPRGWAADGTLINEVQYALTQ
jgi:hypothetical protein